MVLWCDDSKPGRTGLRFTAHHGDTTLMYEPCYGDKFGRASQQTRRVRAGKAEGWEVRGGGGESGICKTTNGSVREMPTLVNCGLRHGIKYCLASQ